MFFVLCQFYPFNKTCTYSFRFLLYKFNNEKPKEYCPLMSYGCFMVNNLYQR